MTANIFKLIFVVIGLFLVYKLIFSNKKGMTIFEMHFKDGRMTQHKGKILKGLKKSAAISLKPKNSLVLLGLKNQETCAYIFPPM